jgi:hypothetical protein
MPARKVPVQFGEWRPDVALLDSQFASEVENVFAGVNSYLPFPSLLPFTTTPLVGACGLYSARTLDGQWKIYGGSPDRLYTWSHFTAGWVDVSRTVGAYTPIASGDLWMFEQSGQHLIAVHQGVEPQWIDIDSGSNFANMPGGPPRATNVKQIGDFLFLSGLVPGSTTGTAPAVPVTNRCLVWSGINDITMWQPGTNLCDMQEFPDGGPVQGVAGSEVGYALQERAIRTIQYLPGDITYIFNFSRVLNDRGSISKYGFSSVGNVLYFVAEDGFYSVSSQQVTPIGADKVNDWWLANTDVGRRNVIHCIAGVNKPRIVWVMHNSSASQTYDREVIFDWSNGRWAKAAVAALVFGAMATTSLDLDTDGTEVNDAWLDTPPFPAARPLDSFAYVGGRPLIAGFDPQGLLCTLQGPNMPATLETAEVHLTPGQRTFVSDVYPLDDALDDATGTVAAGTRERLQNGLTWEPPVMLEITGSAALFSSSRLHRFRRFIPAGTTWTHAQGVMVEAQQDGTVA